MAGIASPTDCRLIGRECALAATLGCPGLEIAPFTLGDEPHRLPASRGAAIRRRVVATLPYGLQKRVDLARALACRPELLILDEPVAGMNREETKDMIDHVIEIKKSWGLTVFLIAHDMEVVMNISDWIAVMNFGVKMAEGTTAEIQKNPEVIRIYLGNACRG